MFDKSVTFFKLWLCEEGVNVDGLPPISSQLYDGLLDAFAHALTSLAGSDEGFPAKSL